MALNNRPKASEQVLQGFFSQIRNVEKIAPHGQTKRLVFFSGFARRVLCSRDKGARPGFLYSKLSRTPFKVGVSSHGLERQPLRFLYVNAADDSLLAITASCDGESENSKQEKPAWTKVERVETSPILRRLSFSLKKQGTSSDRSKSCGEYAQSAGLSSKREERFLGACTGGY
jgi:hypothetical protein